MTLPLRLLTRNFDLAQRKRLRLVVITSILETDMAKHGKHIQWLSANNIRGPGNDASDAEHADASLNMLSALSAPFFA